MTSPLDGATFVVDGGPGSFGGYFYTGSPMLHFVAVSHADFAVYVRLHTRPFHCCPVSSNSRQAHQREGGDCWADIAGDYGDGDDNFAVNERYD